MFGFFRYRSKRPRASKQLARRRLSLERFEQRTVFSAYSVVNLNDHGAGSLRQALTDANQHGGADVIDFDVSGTIRLTTGPLPTITSPVDIDGTSAPGFGTTPLVEVDFNSTSGLMFTSGAAGSDLRSLSLVNAGGSGVTLNGGGQMLIVGNYIGLNPNGTTANGNRGDGLQLINSSGNTIGGDTTLDRNVISANYNNAIDLIISSDNDVLGNYIGTDASGNLDRGNRVNGIVLASSSSNTIGGSTGNLVSGNDNNGIWLYGNSTNNTLSGNIVGLGADGDEPLGNRFDGIRLDGGANNNQIVDLNVIGANGANGISLYGASGNTISENNIGTDITGAFDRGNAQNGILITAGASNNMIGGVATGGNDPTNNVFVRPPEGNLISGNNGDGVLITGGASLNQLSGNFIGTDASGNVALGNSLDGVGIVNASSNSLLGCTFQDNPFVFYNVISGNGSNGLRVTNSNDTTIQANFFGVGADNHTGVGNAQNGVLVEGSSTRTTMGGPIPLGNVDAANGANGIYVRDSASFFTSYNTFCGVAAFSLDTHLGNGNDGILVTSVGGNNLIRTCVISENHHDGVEISGNARDVRVSGNIIGLNTNGFIAMGNLGNGVEVGGNANSIIIGGPQPTFNVIAKNIISANGSNGVAIGGNAFNITVSYGNIGTDITGASARGNGLDGILLGPNTFLNTIGSADTSLPTVIAGNQTNGIEMRGTHNNTVTGTFIGTNTTGTALLGNGANGIYIVGSNDNLIGTTASGTGNTGKNVIAFNLNGILVSSGGRNNIRENSIYGNALLGISLLSGANANQAAPVLTSLNAQVNSTQVTGTLTSKANMQFTLEFFAQGANAPSGRNYIGSIKVTTNSHGVATFTFNGPALPVGAHFVTATATDISNNTSMFSNAQS